MFLTLPFFSVFLPTYILQKNTILLLLFQCLLRTAQPKLSVVEPTTIKLNYGREIEFLSLFYPLLERNSIAMAKYNVHFSIVFCVLEMKKGMLERGKIRS